MYWQNTVGFVHDYTHSFNLLTFNDLKHLCRLCPTIADCSLTFLESTSILDSNGDICIYADLPVWFDWGAPQSTEGMVLKLAHTAADTAARLCQIPPLHP